MLITSMAHQIVLLGELSSDYLFRPGQQQYLHHPRDGTQYMNETCNRHNPSRRKSDTCDRADRDFKEPLRGHGGGQSYVQGGPSGDRVMRGSGGGDVVRSDTDRGVLAPFAAPPGICHFIHTKQRKLTCQCQHHKNSNLHPPRKKPRFEHRGDGLDRTTA